MDTQNLKADGAEVDNYATSGRTAGEAECSKTQSSEPPVPVVLSPTQLLLRRGFTLLVLALILAGGVALRLVFPVPEPTLPSGANGTLTQDYNSTSSPLTLMDSTLTP